MYKRQLLTGSDVDSASAEYGQTSETSPMQNYVQVTFTTDGRQKDVYKRQVPYIGQCKFTGCAHVKEKGCAVRAAVEAGEIAQSRHESYVKLYESVKDLKQWELTKGGTR